MTTLATEPITRKDMSGFLLAHAAMRQEFALLAGVARAPRDADHAALIEEQVALVCQVLHNHHNGEDSAIFTMLRERNPEMSKDLATLEAEHANIDPMLQAARTTSTPLPVRADTFAELHTLINAHLDREERVAVPEIPKHISKAEWRAIGEAAMKENPRRQLPLLFGWFASAGSEELKTGALAEVPALPRLLFRLVWGPSYQRRMVKLYGAAAPGGVPTQRQPGL